MKKTEIGNKLSKTADQSLVPQAHMEMSYLRANKHFPYDHYKEEKLRSLPISTLA
jgi:hypothetical protein